MVGFKLIKFDEEIGEEEEEDVFDSYEKVIDEDEVRCLYGHKDVVVVDCDRGETGLGLVDLWCETCRQRYVVYLVE